jgi:hypothetical protein
MAGATPVDNNTVSFVRFPIVTKNKVYFFNIYDGICVSNINSDGTITPPSKVTETFSANKVFINNHYYILNNKLYIEFLEYNPNINPSVNITLYYSYTLLDVDPNTGSINFNTAIVRNVAPITQDEFKTYAPILLNTDKHFVYSTHYTPFLNKFIYRKKLTKSDVFAQYRSYDDVISNYPRITTSITNQVNDTSRFYKLLTILNRDEIYIYNENSIYRLRLQENGLLTSGVYQFNLIQLLTTLTYNNTALLNSTNFEIYSIKCATTHDKLYIVSVILRDLNNNTNLHLPYVITFDINSNNDLINPTVIANLNYSVIYDYPPTLEIKNIVYNNITYPIYDYLPFTYYSSQIPYNLNEPLVFVTKNHINILQPNMYKNNTHYSYGLLTIPCNFGKNDYLDEYNHVQYVDINSFNHGKPWLWQNGFNSNSLANNFYSQLTLESSISFTDPIVTAVVTKNNIFVFCEKDAANKPKITYLRKLELDTNGNVINSTNITQPMLSDIKVEDALFYMNKIYVIGKLSHSYYYNYNDYNKPVLLTFDIDSDGDLTNPTLLDVDLTNLFNEILTESYTYINLTGRICGLINLYDRYNTLSNRVIGLDIDKTALEAIYDYVNNNMVANNFDIAQFNYIKTNYGMLMYVTYKSIDSSFRNYTEAIKVTVSKVSNAVKYESLGICSSSIISYDVKNFIVVDNFTYFIAKDYDPILNYKAYRIDLSNPTTFTFLGFIPNNNVTNNHLPIVVNGKIYFISSSNSYSVTFNGGSNSYVIPVNENYLYSQTHFKLPLVESPQDFPELEAYIKI